ncbi:cation:proton antiporter [Curvibacter sp. PAE-UM]|uniref:cation:proton antiporter n=1 Tax=Curvibacter sp. PAE-UM TaxID=1714344 RepID=UPI00070F385A|nr:cation:proton antiporter [Curvibacter sp. PAE-UM]KRI01004.1 sodium:proton exchanger [Curvibacter sp. PAE-UM]
MIDLMLNWSEWIRPSAGLPTVQWALLLALAAAAGHLLQRYLGLPKVLGYSAVGALAGFSGYTTASWPLDGIAQFMVELGLSIVLFEAGGRLSLRWLRHNPMLLAQSLGEALATYLAAWWVLQLFGVDGVLHVPLALLLVATSPTVLMRVASDLRASGPVTDRVITLAALNTFYVLALGGVMARLLGRSEATLADAIYPVILLVVASVLVGALLAYALRKALEIMSPTSENTAVLQLSLIVAGTALAAHFGGSAPLAALLAGVLLKTLHPRPWSWPRQFGTASAILTILMFVLVSMAAAQAPWNWEAWSLIAALVLARALAKLAAIALAGLGSGASPRQALWTASAMWPMSAVALLLVSQFSEFAPAIGQPVAAIALPLILFMEVLGALMAMLALQRAGEAGRPPAIRRVKPEGENNDAA